MVQSVRVALAIGLLEAEDLDKKEYILDKDMPEACSCSCFCRLGCLQFLRG